MTIERFKEQFGDDWKKFQQTPLYAGLEAVISANSPSRYSPDTAAGDIVLGSQVLYSEIRGYERLARIIRETLSSTIQQTEPQADYSEPQEP